MHARITSRGRSWVGSTSECSPRCWPRRCWPPPPRPPASASCRPTSAPRSAPPTPPSTRAPAPKPGRRPSLAARIAAAGAVPRPRGRGRPLVAGDGRPADLRDQRRDAADRQGRVLGQTAADRPGRSRTGPSSGSGIRRPAGSRATTRRRSTSTATACRRPPRRCSAPASRCSPTGSCSWPAATSATRPTSAATTPGWRGLDRAYTFDPWSLTWREQPRPRHGRWYPSQVQLADGRIAILAGFDEARSGRQEHRDGGVHARGAARGPRHADLPPGRRSRHRVLPAPVHAAGREGADGRAGSRATRRMLDPALLDRPSRG